MEPFAPVAILSLDPDFSLETGAHLVHAAAFALGAAEARLFRPLEDRDAAGIPLRGLRTLLLDAPIAWWLAVAEHEVFGHGGRAREFGSSASVHLGSPWEGRRSFTTFGVSGLTSEEIQRVFVGGSESNAWSATILERELAAGAALNPLELLYLAAGRLVTSDYVLRTTPDPEDEPEAFHREWAGGGDVANYLGFLSERYTGSFGVTPAGTTDLIEREHRRLRRQAWWNLADPAPWIAAYLVGRYVVTGTDPGPAPRLRVGGRRLWPVLGADWYPDGGAASLEVVVAPGFARGVPSRWSSAVLRRGGGPGGDFWAAGITSDRFLRIGRATLGGEAEAWTRPGRPAGGGVRVWLQGRGRSPGGRFFVEVGVKSPGHWPGRPAGTGAFLRVGYRIRGHSSFSGEGRR